MKQFAILLILFITACKAPNQLDLNLKSVKGANGVLGYTTDYSPFVPDRSSYTSIARALRLDTFIVTTFSFTPEEDMYRDYRSGILPAELYSKLLTAMPVDTSRLKFAKYDGQIHLLMGKRSNGDCVLVADENNNNDLADDRGHVLKNWFNTNAHIELFNLPYVRIDNLTSNYDGKEVVFSKGIILKPGKKDGPDPGYMDRMKIEVVSSDYMLGKFRYKGTGYQVAVRNMPSKYIFDTVRTMIAITRNSEPFRIHFYESGDNIYGIGDTIQIEHAVIIPQTVSTDGRKINLRFSPK